MEKRERREEEVETEEDPIALKVGEGRDDGRPYSKGHIPFERARIERKTDPQRTESNDKNDGLCAHREVERIHHQSGCRHGYKRYIKGGCRIEQHQDSGDGDEDLEKDEEERSPFKVIEDRVPKHARTPHKEHPVLE